MWGVGVWHQRLPSWSGQRQMWLPHSWQAMGKGKEALKANWDVVTKAFLGNQTSTRTGKVLAGLVQGRGRPELQEGQWALQPHRRALSRCQEGSSQRPRAFIHRCPRRFSLRERAPPSHARALLRCAERTRCFVVMTVQGKRILWGLLARV